MIKGHCDVWVLMQRQSLRLTVKAQLKELGAAKDVGNCSLTKTEHIIAEDARSQKLISNVIIYRNDAAYQQFCLFWIHLNSILEEIANDELSAKKWHLPLAS